MIDTSTGIEEELGMEVEVSSNDLILKLLPSIGYEGSYNFKIEVSLAGAVMNNAYTFTLEIESACTLYPLTISYPGIVPD